MTDRCEHGVRHPHPCDDCLELDIPRGRSILDHPRWNPHEAEMTHACALDNPCFCALCGTEIDQSGKAIDGARLSWPQPIRKKPDMTDRQIKALGKLGRTKEGRSFIREHRKALLDCLIAGVGKP